MLQCLTLGAAFRAADRDVDSGGVKSYRRAVSVRQPRGGEQPVVHVQRPRAMQRPWIVAGSRDPAPAASHAEKDPPSGEEMVASVKLVGGVLLADPDRDAARRVARTRQYAAAPITDLPARGCDAHRRPEVRQPVGRPGHTN